MCPAPAEFPPPADDRPGPDAMTGGLSRLLLARRGLAAQVAISAATVAVATWVRHAVDASLPPGFPFLTFFPAVMLVAILASLRAGIAVAVVCGLIAWAWFIPPRGALSVEPPALVAMGFYAAITAAELFFIGMTAEALRQMQAARLRADAMARSRDLMFSELQHRVSNNLATIGALLRMQAGRVQNPEAKQALVQAMQRLTTVARLQRSLHAPDEQEVEVSGFLAQLARDTLDSAAAEDAALTVEAEEFRLNPDRAIPFGLVASEMVMNALEHGRPAKGRPALAVRFAVQGPEAVLEIADNGPGLPEGHDIARTGSLGLGIAVQFARQLGGDLTLANGTGGGAVARLRFPA